MPRVLRKLKNHPSMTQPIKLNFNIKEYKEAENLVRAIISHNHMADERLACTTIPTGE